MTDKANAKALPTWDLAAIYKNADEWEADFAKLRPMADTCRAFSGKLGEGAKVLNDAFMAFDEFNRLAEKVYVYASMKSDENTLIGENRARVGRIESLFAELSPCFAWFDPELMALPQKTIDGYLKSKTLAFYRRSLEETLRGRAHTLSKQEECLLGAFSDVIGAPAHTFETLNDGDLTFGKLKNGAGQTMELTHGSYHLFMEDADRAVRKAAFRKLYTAYEKLRNTFASTLDATMKAHAVGSQVRHFGSTLEAALFSDKVPTTVYTQLIDTVHSRVGHLQRYLKLRAKVLKLDKLDMYDIYNPLLPAVTERFPFERAEKLVKEALAPLGEEYVRDLGRAFAERWIDAPERKGKRSGAYSSGCYDTYPYLLLNYNSTLDDVFTLAHELGHSMHSFYSHRAQQYHYAGYRIFVAEVASTTNEILLSEYLLKRAKTREQRAYLYGHLLDEIRGTIYRQTMFAEFELDLHRKAEAGVPLTADELTKEYYELNKLYYGDAVEADKMIGLEWARIPHFYYDFYVYKYATGMSAALVLAKNLLSGDAAKREAYLGFLRAGDSKDVLDIMKDAGVDLSTPAPVAAALDYFGETVGKLKAELGL